MNCDNDFYVRYDKTYVKVKPFCESSNIHYKIYLHDREVKLLQSTDENGQCSWVETGKGNSELANELGKLIESQKNKNSV